MQPSLQSRGLPARPGPCRALGEGGVMGARYEPLFDVDPRTGASIEFSMQTARWKHSADAAPVGSGALAGALLAGAGAYRSVCHELFGVSARDNYGARSGFRVSGNHASHAWNLSGTFCKQYK